MSSEIALCEKEEAVSASPDRAFSGRDHAETARRIAAPPDPAVCLRRGLEFLRRRQFPSGEFSTLTWMGDKVEYDGSLFATTFVLYSLAFVKDADARKIQEKGLDFLEREVLPNGLWRFWNKQSPNVQKMPYGIPPDVDDTCCVSFLLRKYRAAPDNRRLLLSNRNRRGLFYTWMLPRQANFAVSPGFWLNGVCQMPIHRLMWAKTEADRDDVDCCVNANVLFYLGRRPETEAAARFVEETIEAGRGSVEDKWYAGIPCFYLLSRAHFCDPSFLSSVKNRMIEALEETLEARAPATTPLEAALAICTFLNFGYAAPIAKKLIEILIERQGADGEWPCDVFHYGGPSRVRSYGSSELTTAICLEAVSRFFGERGV